VRRAFLRPLAHALDRTGTTGSQVDELIEIERAGATAVVTMKFGQTRPALDHAGGEALVRALHELNRDTACRAIVIAGDGADFCPGGDFSRGAGEDADPIALRGRLRTATTLFRDMRRAPKPILAAVEGVVRGGGLALVCASDHVVAASDATFRCDALEAGLVPDGGLLWSLPERVGHAKAGELILLGRAMPAEDALWAGLADELAVPGAALERALAAARRFESLPAAAVALIKAAAWNGGTSIEDGCRLELDLNPLSRQAADHLEAVAAFMERRPPHFTGN